jgi:hypothetical protein
MIVLKTIARYAEVCSENLKYVVAYQLNEDDAQIDEVPVFRDGLDRLETQRKRRLPTGVSQWYVSNEVGK